MTTAVLYHADCLDGFTAAWVTYKALIDDDKILMRPVTHGNPPPELEDDVDAIYIVDFAYPHHVMREMAIRRRVVVLDHHQTAITDICDGHSFLDDGTSIELDQFYETMLDVSRSGAGIAWDYFHPDKPRAPLVDYVEDRDLWQFKLPQSKEVTAFLRSQPQTLNGWDTINETMTTDDMATAGVGALAHINAYARAATNHAYWCDMGGRRFPIVNVTYESCSEVVDLIMEQFGFDMAGYFFQRDDGNWQYGFRARNGATVHEFAKGFGGGGHPTAAGCVTPEPLHKRVDR